MLKNTLLKKLRLDNVFIPLLVVALSCTLLIASNYLTIKILSASRAYINGESHYSKGQKDATRHLTTYLLTSDSNEWQSFQRELSVPKGDKIARLGLINNAPIETIEAGLRAGRNNSEDFDDLIWLFKNFRSVSFFAEAIKEWENADLSIEKLAILGQNVNQKITAKSLTSADKENILKKINTLSIELNQNEKAFSEKLSSGLRSIKNLLLLINIFFSLIIIGSVSIYYWVIVTKLKRSKTETEETNKSLTIVNKELDQFVYSASHDLRSPISSLKGLIEIMNTENNVTQLRAYLALMNQNLDKQDQFIKDIIEYSRNKKTKLAIKKVSLIQTIEEAINQNQFRQETKKISINKTLNIDNIDSDELKLKIIINNLLTNAIKYSDSGKENCYITINTYADDQGNKIVISDNGIGIKPEYQNKIFDMFFVTNNNNKGTGLGLYLVKDAIKTLNGTIEITSKINIGTKFTINLPKKYDQLIS